jgi:hypothetical protein
MKTRNLSLLTGLILAASLITGCASVAHIEKDESTDFSKYKTFAWIDREEEKQRLSDLTQQNLQNAVNKELEEVGWREVKARPDILLNYDILVERTTKQESNPVYSRPYIRPFYNPYTRSWGRIYYPSQFLGYDYTSYPVKEGTLTITMIDARTNKTIWQGWTTEEVNSVNLTSKEIQNSVKAIFKKFDIAKK